MLVFLCFTLVATGYLAWLYRLLEFVPEHAADALSMVGGYGFQAAGIGTACVMVQKRVDLEMRIVAIAALALHLLLAGAAAFATSLAGALAFGWAMNFTCGIISCGYLMALAQWTPHDHRGIAFGGGYALSSLATWMLSALQGGNPLGPTTSIAACSALTLIIMVALALQGRTPEGQGRSPRRANSADEAGKKLPPSSAQDADAQPLTSATAGATGKSPTPMASSVADAQPLAPAAERDARSLIAVACLTVLMLSLVKNLAFDFPTASLSDGVSLEASRLFYAMGLVLAGVVADRSRKYSSLCCMAALAVPFFSLIIANESVAITVLWAVNYLFFGFFSVYRAVLMVDMAAESRQLHFAGFGLLFGRVGDALGTAAYLTLARSTVVLASMAAVLFAATVFAFWHLYQRLYAAPIQVQHAQAKSDEQLFAEFSARYQLSVREREVLRQVLAERTNAETAAELFVTEATVKFHVRNLLKKTGCKNRIELLTLYADQAR